MIEMRRMGIPAFAAAVTLALSLSACGGVDFEEYPSTGVTQKADAQSTADLTQSLATSTPEFFTDIGKAGVAWMDHLKTCAPYSQTYQSPYQKVLQINTIQGMDGGYCLMTMVTTDYAILSCRLDSEGIKAFTSEELYADMTDIHSAQPDDASDDVLKTQCTLEMLGPTDVLVKTPAS